MHLKTQKIMNGGGNKSVFPNLPIKYSELGHESGAKWLPCNIVGSIDIIDANVFPVGYMVSVYHLRDYIVEENSNKVRYWKEIIRHPNYERYVTEYNGGKPFVVFVNEMDKH